ncbi:myozenin-3 [Salmo trutta]|uniref:Myozenin-3-like n=2 Tax=Salmo trutta TaxID=8032 RepID=A0A674APP8_SALTR|nr:myozenin-3-like [Salmo trutta]
MQEPDCDLAKQRKQLVQELCMEKQGEHFDLGKKISAPQDVMMEELNLRSNRGSRMYQERQKRVERFTLENVAPDTHRVVPLDPQQPDHSSTHNQGALQVGKNNYHTEVYIGQPGRNSLVRSLKNTIASKGNPSVLAPGYNGPLKEVPHERFNVTVIPKSYCSPWQVQDQNGNSDKLLSAISAHLPELPQKLTPNNYRCFNRAPLPFGGTAGSVRMFPLPGFELLQAHTEPSRTWESICDRPNFNRTPRGWAAHYTAETETSDL